MDIIRKFEPLFGEWVAESLLGAGSFGRVYKIRREAFGESFYSAMKYISLPQNDGELQQLRFEGLEDNAISDYYGHIVREIAAEMHMMDKLRGHNGIVTYLEHTICPKAGGPGFDIFIRMELLTGLNTYARKNPMRSEELVRLGVSLCNALELCEEHRILHRDVKPENIFVSANGEFRLGDFCLARQLERTQTSLSKKGTSNYMAPEVYRGDHYDGRADLYSLGIVLYRLLNNNRLPLLPQGSLAPADRSRALANRMRGEPLPLPTGAKNELGKIVLKACAFDPAERFQTARELREALTAWEGAMEQAEAHTPPKFINSVIEVNWSAIPTATGARPVQYCHRCGNKLATADERFCAHCGFSLAPLSPAAPTVPALPLRKVEIAAPSGNGGKFPYTVPAFVCWGLQTVLWVAGFGSLNYARYLGYWYILSVFSILVVPSALTMLILGILAAKKRCKMHWLSIPLFSYALPLLVVGMIFILNMRYYNVDDALFVLFSAAITGPCIAAAIVAIKGPVEKARRRWVVTGIIGAALLLAAVTILSLAYEDAAFFLHFLIHAPLFTGLVFFGLEKKRK